MCWVLKLGHESGTVSLKNSSGVTGDGWCWLQDRRGPWAGHLAGVNSVLHIREPSKGATHALEEHGSRAPRGLWAKMTLSANIFCSVLLFCLWTWSCVQERCLLIVFKLLFTLSVTGPSTSLHLHKHVSQCWHLYSELIWENSMVPLALHDLLWKPKCT